MIRLTRQHESWPGRSLERARRGFLSRILGVVIGVLAHGSAPTAGVAASIEGRVTRDGTGLLGVTVRTARGGASVLTDFEGRYALEGVPAGSLDLQVEACGHLMHVPSALVEPEGVTRVDVTLPPSAPVDCATATWSLSRRAEAQRQAPAAGSVVPHGAVQRQSGGVQVPRALSRELGVRIPQSGMHDFNVNIRGFNEPMNRRIRVLVDGRDASIPGLGSPEWLSFPTPADDLDRVELTRGPSSAMHGSNALNGVVAFRSRELADLEPGGSVRFAWGERDHGRFDVRQVATLAPGWRARVHGSVLGERDFSRDRNSEIEYPGPFWERAPRATDRTRAVRGGLRLDRELATGGRLSFEGNFAELDGWIASSSIGRLQVLDSRRAWGRVEHDSERWSLRASHDTRDGDHYSPLSGQHLLLDGSRLDIDGERRFRFHGTRGRLLVGGAYRHERAGSRDAEGMETALRTSSADSAAVFGQLEHEVTETLRFLLAARVDVGDLHDLQLSPRLGFVWRARESQVLRLMLTRGFRAPSLWETKLRFPTSGPVGFAQVEESLAPQLGGVPLHFDQVEVLGLGSSHLEVESAEGIELGYVGQLSERVTLSVDYSRTRVRNLVSALLPNVGTELGRLNPTYGPYRPPEDLTPEQRQLVLDTLQAELAPRLLAQLSNDLDGRPILADLTYASVGDADTQGLDLGLGIRPGEHWRIDLSYSWFDFNPRKQLETEPLVANAPQHAAALALGHVRPSFDATAIWRWVDGHEWSAGSLGRGTVPTHDVLDLSANYRVTPGFSLGLDVANAFDHRHHEIWGGDVLGRRAVARATLRW